MSRTRFAMGTWTLALVATALLGCSTLRGRADDAFDHGRFLEAADLYDRIVRDDPKDAEAQARRTAARNAALRKLLADAGTARAAGHREEAVGKVTELLARRDAWGGMIEQAVAPALAVEVAAAGSFLEASVAARAKSAGPLVGEQLARRYDPLLTRADLAPWRAQIRVELRAAGSATCATLGPTATTPYWSWVIASYCTHFGAPAVEVPALPNLHDGLAIDGSIIGETAEEAARLRTTLEAAFRRSVWYAPNTGATVHAVVDGQLAATFGSEMVSLGKNWNEQVPYTDYETSQESYQEPYDETEYYTEQVPSTRYETETHPCGDTTCTDSHPVTVYTSETRTRTVTHYRTAWRTVTNPVTRYRDVPHVFTYQALRRTGHYTSSVRLRVDRELPDVAAIIESNFKDEGVDHDATFEAAGVSPERANLMTAEAFVVREEGRLRDRFREVLDERYAELYCRAAQYTVEEAAACVYLDPERAPTAARNTLRTVFGADEPFLPTVLARATAP